MGRKELNPVDAYRKEQKKKELKKHQKDRQKSKETNKLLNNPEKIETEIRRVERESNHNRLDKSLQDKLRELKAMKVVANRRQAQKNLMNEAQSLSQTEKKHEESSVSHVPSNLPLNQYSYLGVGSHILQQSPMVPPYGLTIQPPALSSLPYMTTSYPHANASYPPAPPVILAPRSIVPDQRLQREIIDPLDPAATGYTHRFGSENQKRKRNTQETIPNPPFPATNLQIPVSDQSTDVSSHEQPTSNEVENQVIDMSPTFTPQINIAEIMKRRKMLINDDVVGPVLPTVEPKSGQNQIPSLPGISCYSDTESETEVESKQPQDKIEEPVNFIYPASMISPQMSLEQPIQSKSPNPNPVQTKRSVRVESDLVSFVPAALRIKRNCESQPKISKNPQISHVSSSQNQSNLDPGKRDSHSVDEAYEQFMLEISSLG